MSICSIARIPRQNASLTRLKACSYAFQQLTVQLRGRFQQSGELKTTFVPFTVLGWSTVGSKFYDTRYQKGSNILKDCKNPAGGCQSKMNLNRTPVVAVTMKLF